MRRTHSGIFGHFAPEATGESRVHRPPTVGRALVLWDYPAVDVKDCKHLLDFVEGQAADCTASAMQRPHGNSLSCVLYQGGGERLRVAQAFDVQRRIELPAVRNNELLDDQKRARDRAGWNISSFPLSGFSQKNKNGIGKPMTMDSMKRDLRSSSHVNSR